MLKTRQHLPGPIARPGFRLPAKVRQVQQGMEDVPGSRQGVSWGRPLPGGWGPRFSLGSGLATASIGAAVGNSCFPAAPNAEDSEASPPPNPTGTRTRRCCRWGRRLWGSAGARRVPSRGSGVVPLPDLPRNSHLPFFFGGGGCAIRGLCKAAGAAGQCCLRELP